MFSPAAQAPPPLPVLHYEAHWRLLPAGTASLSWSTTPTGERRIHFTADSSKLVSLFYPVRDRMESTYDPQSLCTSSVENQTVEGSRRRQTRIDFKPSQGEMVLNELDTAHQPPLAKHEVKPIPGCVLDLFSALDYTRGQRLRVGDVYHFPVNEGGGTSEVRVKVDLKETVTTPAGTFTTVRVEPEVYASPIFHRPGHMWVWFSDDARHLPVQIKATVRWGTILVQLVN